MSEDTNGQSEVENQRTDNTMAKVWRYQWAIRSRKSKDRQHNGQKTKDRRTNNDLQNITQKTKDWATGTPLIPRGELRCSGG